MKIEVKTCLKYIVELTEEEKNAFHREQYNADLDHKPITKAMIRQLENRNRYGNPRL